ncbi:unnamed protein product [Rotaria socialis]|nr:unnamed protein product [Rotaria socialis]
MECRLVLNNRSTVDIPNDVLCGQLQQQLKYYKFRRGGNILRFSNCSFNERYLSCSISSSNSIVDPLRRPDDIPSSEMHYRPIPTKTIVDMIRYNYTRYFNRFSNKAIFKLFVRRVSEQIVVQRLKIPEG